MGIPGDPTYGPYEIAVNSKGEIFASNYKDEYTVSFTAFKWISGTTWSSEESTSRHYVDAMTGGPGGQVWGISNNQMDHSSNIYTRVMDGSNITWLNDERVRTTDKGNSIMIPVNPGTYTLTQTTPANWKLNNIRLYDPTSNSTSNTLSNQVTLNIAANEVVTVLFENGLVNPYTMTNNCGVVYKEDFGSGALNTFGPALVGQTPYHYLNTSEITIANDYKIIGNANLLFDGLSMFDHTTGNGTGRMMAVDANNEPDAFFRRRFNGLIIGRNYDFSAYIANINSEAELQPNVTFEIIDHKTNTILKSLNTCDILTDRVWTRYGLSFVANDTTIDLVIRNNGLGGYGNDLALDDIEFRLLNNDATSTVNYGNCSSLGNITINYPVGAEYSYSLDNSNWQSSNVFNSLSNGIYNIYIRNSTTGCVTLITDTIHPKICGSVFVDLNGNTIINAGEGGTNLDTVVYVYLVDSNNVIVGKTIVQPDGSYILPAQSGQTYTLYMSLENRNVNTSISGVVNVVLPNGWARTGENGNNNSGPGDGNPDGKLNVYIGTSSVDNQNFGIERIPYANAKTYLVSNSAFSDTPPLGYPDLSTPGNRYFHIPTSHSELTGYMYNGYLTGNDAEDCPLSESCNATSTFIIDSLYPTTLLFYNYGGGIGVRQIVNGDLIPNYDPSKLIIYAIEGSGVEDELVIGFDYRIRDRAGVDSDPVPYKIYTESALPIVLVSFIAIANDCQVNISWTTASELNNNYFELQTSNDAINWVSITKVKGRGNSNLPYNYQYQHQPLYKGINYYRLKQVDFDGTSEYHSIISVQTENCDPVNIRIYPNPAQNNIVVDLGSDVVGRNVKALIFDNSGRKVGEFSIDETLNVLDIQSYVDGVYIVQILENNQSIYQEKLVVKK